MDMSIGNMDPLELGASKWCSFFSFHRKSHAGKPEIVTQFDPWKLSVAGVSLVNKNFWGEKKEVQIPRLVFHEVPPKR